MTPQRPSPESAPPEPVHLVVETGDRTVDEPARPLDLSIRGIRVEQRTTHYVDDEGQFRLRVNDRDYDMDLGTELASTSVTVLLIGRHVFVTLSENGELLRELLLNPEHEFRPE